MEKKKKSDEDGSSTPTTVRVKKEAECRGHTKGISLEDINHGVPSTYGLHSDDPTYPLIERKMKKNKTIKHTTE